MKLSALEQWVEMGTVGDGVSLKLIVSVCVLSNCTHLLVFLGWALQCAIAIVSYNGICVQQANIRITS